MIDQLLRHLASLFITDFQRTILKGYLCSKIRKSMRIQVFFTICVLLQLLTVVSLGISLRYIIQTYKMQLQTRVSEPEYTDTRAKSIDTAYENTSKYNLKSVILKERTSPARIIEQPTVGRTTGLSDSKLHKRQNRHKIISDEILHNFTNKVLFFKTRKPVLDVNCRSIIANDVSEIRKASLWSKIHHKRFISPETYISITHNCKQFKLKRGYITNALTNTENNFPVAFSLLMYKDVEQTERLLRSIYRPQNIYCIHVDLKTKDTVYNAVRSIANCFENVFTASKRINVTWGNFTVLEPDILCMQELWNKSKTWKYFINLTGQEFPLRTNYELVRILSTFNGSNDAYAKVGDYKFKKRLDGAGEPPYGIVPMKGAVHVVVSRAFVDYVLNDQRAQAFLNWTKLTRHPDETFFPSLHKNPSLQVPGSNTGHWFARFKNWGQYFCRGKYMRGVCIFGIGDLPFLASRCELFANKFHLDYHPFALDCIEELHFNRTRDEYFNNSKFDTTRYLKKS